MPGRDRCSDAAVSGRTFCRGFQIVQFLHLGMIRFLCIWERQAGGIEHMHFASMPFQQPLGFQSKKPGEGSLAEGPEEKQDTGFVARVIGTP